MPHRNSRRRLVASGCFVATLLSGSAQAQYWSRTHLGVVSSGEVIDNAATGGFVEVTGYFTGASGEGLLVTRLDDSGALLWQKLFEVNGALAIAGTWVRGLADGGFLVAASYTTQFQPSNYEPWVLRLDASGNVIRQQSYSAPGDQIIQSLALTSDGGAVVAGLAQEANQNERAWAMKLDAGGRVDWSRAWSGMGSTQLAHIGQLADGGYVVGGSTTDPQGTTLALVMQLKPNGLPRWQRTITSSANTHVRSIVEAPEGALVVTGIANRVVTSLNPLVGSSRLFVATLDAQGNLLWQQGYDDGSPNKDGFVIRQTPDAGFVVAGDTLDAGFNLVDGFLLRVDSLGGVVWQNSYGLSGQDELRNVELAHDGGFIAGGRLGSLPLQMRTDAEGRIGPSCPLVGATPTSLTDPGLTASKAKLTSTTLQVMGQDPAASVTDFVASLDEQCSAP